MLYLNQNRSSISEAFLKNTAYVSMLIDHFFAIVFYKLVDWLSYQGNPISDANTIYRVGRAVGRPAFILFAFMAVEGFKHTHSRPKYLLHLFLFALLSEIPFDLAFHGKIFMPQSQNTLFTLFLGVLALCLMEYAKGYPALQAFAVFACGLLAMLLKTDYMIMGVFLVVILYLYRKDFFMQFLAGGVIMYFGIVLNNVYRYWDFGYPLSRHMKSGAREMYGLAAFLLIFFYNGERGKQLPKLCYYLFYPLHLIILFYIGRLFSV